MKIGLLEDNPTLVEFMRTALELAGHNVFTYSWGRSLLEALFVAQEPSLFSTIPTLPYDLLIVDLNLPGGLSGQDVIAAIYQLLAPEVLPIIVVSAGSPYELDQLHQDFPALPIIRKPFTLHALLHTISLSHPKEKEQVPWHEPFSKGR